MSKPFELSPNREHREAMANLKGAAYVISQDTHKAPGWYDLAENRAYRQGYRHARFGVPMLEAGKGIRRRWPQAYSRGYWEGHACGPWKGYRLAVEP